jgi:hypothetical protein
MLGWHLVKYHKSREELVENLLEQIEFLRESCRLYDAGKRREAKRLATTLYILAHDGTQQKSLLRLLGLRGERRFISAADPKIGREICVPLIIWSDPTQGGYFAPDFHTINGAKDRLRRLAFSDWWDEKLYVSVNNVGLSRKNLIFALRSQDGGAHVDASLKDSSYHWLMTKSADGARTFEGGFAVEFDPRDITKDGVLYAKRMLGDPAKEGHLAIMRVIAWEVDETLKAMGY